MINYRDKVEKMINKICGEDGNYCECDIEASAGQTNGIPRIDTKIRCRRKIYPREKVTKKESVFTFVQS